MIRREIPKGSKFSSGVKECPRCLNKKIKKQTGIILNLDGSSIKDMSCQKCTYVWTEFYRDSICRTIEFED